MPEDRKHTYTFSRDDLLKLDATAAVAIEAYQTGTAGPIGVGSRQYLDDHLQWLAALRNDITIRLGEV